MVAIVEGNLCAKKSWIGLAVSRVNRQTTELLWHRPLLKVHQFTGRLGTAVKSFKN